MVQFAIDKLISQLCREHGWDGENLTTDDEVTYNDAHMRVRSAVPEYVDATSQTFSWELPSLPDYFLLGLISQAMKSPEGIRPSMMFSLFLCMTVRMRKDYLVSDSVRLEMLLSSALRGYEPAQAVIPTVFAFYEKPYPAHIEQKLRGWLYNAVASGSLTARAHLYEVSPKDVPDAIQSFKASGGYGNFLNRRNLQLPPLQHAASFETVSLQEALLDSCPGTSFLDRTTSDGETALYHALAGGAWDIASAYLNAAPALPSSAPSFA